MIAGSWRTPANGALLSRISALPLFDGIGRRGLQRLVRQIDWFCVPGGWFLFREGDPAEAVHVVIAGRLGALITGEGREDHVVAEIGAGETVGEMALLTDAPRSATLVALRDSELIRIPRPVFEALIDKSPAALRHLGQTLARRLNRTAHAGTTLTRPATIAVISASPGADAGGLARGLTAALAHSGVRAVAIGPSGTNHTADWFHTVERENDHVIYFAPDARATWARLCMRRADRVVFVAHAWDPPPAAPVCIENGLPSRPCDMVLLHPADAAAPRGIGGWLDRLPVRVYSNLRIGNRSDIARLARVLTGRAVGLVLSGGGARGFAHIGVIRALREAGVPVDIVGGTSMGAIVGAGIALEWDNEAFIDHMRRCFVDTNPLNDYAVPLVALVRGRKVTRQLVMQFGETRIEDLWRPYFSLSANLTSGEPHLHDRGSLARALRASVAIPGVLPPVIENGEVLVDGSVLNNFPADIMAEFDRGPVIGVDVGRMRSLGGADAAPRRWIDGIFHRLRGGQPGIVEILMRAGTASSDGRSAQLRNYADFLFEPPVESVDLRDWKAFDRVVDAGYRHASEKLERSGPALLKSLSDSESQIVTAA